MEQGIKILGIETSCDETAAAVVRDGRYVMSNVIYTQVPTHTLYGGVVPEIASREHIKKINQVIRKALADANCTWEDIDAIAVTKGPGLVGPLLVGVGTAKAVAYAKSIPLVGVNHIEGHIYANFIEDTDNPYHDRLAEKTGSRLPSGDMMCLVASGGHSHIVRIKGSGTDSKSAECPAENGEAVTADMQTEIEIIGCTHDDAAGEAFDKVARALGLGYPGGPKIDKLVREENGNPHAVEFPRAKVGDSSYDFSFSGLKSAVLNYLNGCEMKGIEVNRADVAASFQQAVVDVLTEHTVRAAVSHGCDTVLLAGGVAANTLLRETMCRRAEEAGLMFSCPSFIYCTDNGAMIGAVGYKAYMNEEISDIDLNAYPNLKIGEG